MKLSDTIKYLSLFSLTICFLSCVKKEETQLNKAAIKKEGLVKSYRKNGKLKSAINFSNGKKNGLAESYYKNGKLHYAINYKDDIKHGKAFTYYENGLKYRETSQASC